MISTNLRGKTGLEAIDEMIRQRQYDIDELGRLKQDLSKKHLEEVDGFVYDYLRNKYFR